MKQIKFKNGKVMDLTPPNTKHKKKKECWLLWGALLKGLVEQVKELLTWLDTKIN